jgi:hypothetical protein
MLVCIASLDFRLQKSREKFYNTHCSVSQHEYATNDIHIFLIILILSLAQRFNFYRA